jgi:hypothetical protein
MVNITSSPSCRLAAASGYCFERDSTNSLSLLIPAVASSLNAAFMLMVTYSPISAGRHPLHVPDLVITTSPHRIDLTVNLVNPGAKSLRSVNHEQSSDAGRNPALHKAFRQLARVRFIYNGVVCFRMVCSSLMRFISNPILPELDGVKPPASLTFPNSWDILREDGESYGASC